MKLNGKVALVTGGGTGIGAAMLVDAGTSIVDVLGASIMAELRKGGVMP